MVRAHIFYSGTVQGIGFRYTVNRLADPLGLNGWVRNVNDGRVEILAEGPRGTIEEFCRQIEEHFGGYVHHKDIDFAAAEGNLTKFKIH